MEAQAEALVQPRNWAGLAQVWFGSGFDLASQRLRPHNHDFGYTAPLSMIGSLTLPCLHIALPREELRVPQHEAYLHLVSWTPYLTYRSFGGAMPRWAVSPVDDFSCISA